MGFTLVNPSAFPTNVRNGINDGMGRWNRSSCNEDHNDFPFFNTIQSGQNSSGGAKSVRVEWHSGLGPVGNGGQRVCATMDPGGRTDGTNSTINLYEKTEINGTERTCYINKAIANDSFAHEVGHYLGLDHPASGCNGSRIMGPRTSRIVNNIFVWNTNRDVQGNECATADEKNWTPQEEAAEEPNECDPLNHGRTPEPDNGLPACDPDYPTPIVLDVFADGLQLVGVDDAVYFDIDADGLQDRITWTAQGAWDGFLVLDRNNNGVIDDGTELFGNATPLLDGTVAQQGFQALAELDLPSYGGNANGEIDPGDGIFPLLQLWFDFNHDGVSSPRELLSLGELRITRLSYSFLTRPGHDEHGNRERMVSDGSRRPLRARQLAPNPIEKLFEVIDVIFVRDIR